MSLECALAGVCAGCPWIEQPLATQHDRKREHFRQTWQAAGLAETALGDVPIHTIDNGALRDRVDLTLQLEPEGMCLGLYDLDHRRIVDMSRCPMMSPELEAWLVLFRTRIPTMKLGSIRLRIAPDGRRGLWCDFPNLEIKQLLDEGSWLRAMKALAHVEMGQKRKVLIERADGLALGDPEALPWFETYLGDAARPQPLYCSVGGFTQPGFRANRALVGKVVDLARACGANHWLELGAGIGNFTLPLASFGWQVTAVENDPRAIEGLERSLSEAGLSELVRIEQANMHRRDAGLAQLLAGVDGILADPPRSGQRGFIDVIGGLPEEARPHSFLYISCFAESLIEDLVRLGELGYEVQSVEGLDQFPQSVHCEWLVVLKHKACT